MRQFSARRELPPLPIVPAYPRRPLIPLTLGSNFSSLCLFGLPVDNWHQSLPALALILPEFEGEHLGWSHLDVEEFDDAPKFGRYHIGNEQHPNAPGLKVGFDELPISLWVGPVDQISQQSPLVSTGGGAICLEARPNLIQRPIHNAI